MKRNYDPVALTGGRWVLDPVRRVQVWEPWNARPPVVDVDGLREIQAEAAAERRAVA